MAGENDLSGQVGLDTTAFKTGVSELNAQIKSIETSFRASAAQMDSWSETSDGLKARVTSLGSELTLQKQKLELLNTEYQKTVDKQGADSSAAQSLASQMYSVEQKINSTQSQLNKYNSELSKNEAEAEKSKSALGQLNTVIEQQQTQLDKLKSDYVNVTLEQGKDSTAAQDLKAKMQSLNTELGDNKSKLDAAKTAANDLGTAEQDAGKKAESASNGGFTVFKGTLANLASNVIQSAVSSLKSLATSVLDSADKIQQMSDQTGLSSEAIQKWQYVGDTLGVSVDTITGSLSKMINNMDSATKGSGTAYVAFQKLGVSVKDDVTGQLRDSNDVFEDTLTALAGVSNETERTAIAQDIFGKSASDLNPLLKAGTDQLEALGQQAQDTGAIMSDDTVSSLDDFGDTLGQLQQSLLATAGTILSDLAPSVQGFVDGLKTIDLSPIENMLKWIIDNASIIISLPAGIAAGFIAFNVASTIMGVVEAFKAFKTAQEGATIAQWLLNVAMSANSAVLIITLIAGVVAALVVLWNTNEGFRDVVISIWDGIKSFFQAIGNWFATDFAGFFIAAWNGIVAVWNTVIGFFRGIWDGIKNVFGKVSEWFRNIFGAAASGTQSAWNGIIGFFGGVWDGIQGAFSAVGNWFGNIFESAKQGIYDHFNPSAISDWFAGIWDDIKNGFSTLNPFEWGADLINGLADGIRNAAYHVKQAVGNVAQNIRDFLHFSKPDTGPLVDFDTYMPDMMSAMANGITGNIGKLRSAAANAAAAISSGLSVNLNSSGQLASSNSTTNYNSYGPAQEVTVLKVGEEVVTGAVKNRVSRGITNEGISVRRSFGYGT